MTIHTLHGLNLYSQKLSIFISLFLTGCIVDPVVDRVERNDRLACFVDRLDQLHRLVDDFTTQLDSTDFRSTCGHVDHSFLLVLAYYTATDAKNSVFKHLMPS